MIKEGNIFDIFFDNLFSNLKTLIRNIIALANCQKFGTNWKMF